MHELSVCQAMLEQVAHLAKRYGARYVEAIDVEIGELSGIDPLLFADAFSVMRFGTCAAAAILNARSIQPRVLCIQCGARTYAPANRLTCGSCSGFRISVIEGTELTLRDVKLQISTE
jgi:hydrogenase nickel incorporation protein HypA/HybF